MSPATTTDQLAGYEQRYRELAGQLATVGFIQAGTLLRRYNRCGSPGCRCHADPPALHGPYDQWTAKVKGKTVTRRLSPAAAALYEEWIANDRRLRQIIEQMREVAAKVAELRLSQAAHP